VEIDLENGLPLGIAADASYPESSLRLAPGDTVTFLSDGVLEARNAAGELYGFERTAALSTESAENVAQAAQAFGQEDDITVLTLKRAASY
jgi:serine phosphatase RsbU (regulator of sigma subunit)